MKMCKKCQGISAGLLLLLGALFLLKDLNVWSLWGINWWSAVLILLGVVKLASRSCADCEACCTTKKK